MQDLATHGDPLEKHYAAFIQNHLPFYEKIWQAYIGNDGHSRPLPTAPPLSDDDGQRRDRLAQNHYSCLESILCMKEIAEDRARLDDLTRRLKTNDARAALELSNLFLVFHAHMGRIYDLVKKLGEDWGEKSLADKLGDYWEKRQNVLHGAKIPIGALDGALAVVLPAGIKTDTTGWTHRTSTWFNREAIEPTSEFLSEYLGQTASGMMGLLNGCLASLHSRVCAHLREMGIHLLDPVGIQSRIVEAPCSGSFPPFAGRDRNRDGW